VHRCVYDGALRGMQAHRFLLVKVESGEGVLAAVPALLVVDNVASRWRARCGGRWYAVWSAWSCHYADNVCLMGVRLVAGEVSSSYEK
jgi:hypothetical protein